MQVTVYMCVTYTGGPFTDHTGKRQTTINVTKNKTTFPIEFPTNHDWDDEDSGPINVKLLPDTGYALVQGKTTAFVKVYDNDPPAELRANGHLAVRGGDTNASIRLRWKESGTTKYDVLIQPQLDGLSSIKRLNVANRTETNLPDLMANKLYKLAVGSTDESNWYRDHKDKKSREKIVDASIWPEVWSEVVVYPTDEPPSSVMRVAGIPVNKYQANGKFAYKICSPSQAPQNENQPSQLPEGFSVFGSDTTTSLIRVIGRWDVRVKWRKANGDNIIETSGWLAETCQDPESTETQNQVVFYSEQFTENYCDPDMKVSVLIFGCWKSDADLSAPSIPETIVMRDSLPDPHTWTDLAGSGSCRLLESILRHEVGHPFGLGDSRSAEALMWEYVDLDNLDKVICEPNIWDVTATMANYQSR